MKPYRPPVYAPTGGIPSFEDQEDDPRALWNSVHVGDPLGMASPSEDMAMKRLLGEHAVERTRRERAAADADGQTSIARSAMIRAYSRPLSFTDLSWVS